MFSCYFHGDPSYQNFVEASASPTAFWGQGECLLGSRQMDPGFTVSTIYVRVLPIPNSEFFPIHLGEKSVFDLLVSSAGESPADG